METVVEYIDENGKPTAPPASAQSTGSNYIPTLSKTDKADLLDKIRPERIVEILRNKLLGKEEDINGNWVVKPELKKRALTETGAHDISNIMLGVSSQNVALSRLNDHEIRERTLSIVKTVQHMLLKNWKEYGIQGVDQLEFVHQLVISNTFITLKQPEHGGIRELIKGITQETRNVTETQEKKGGFFRKR